MGKPKFKIDKTVKKEIAIAVAHLPVLYKAGVFTQRKVYGGVLIKEGVTEVNGKPVVPQQFYVQRKNVQINHLVEAAKEYKVGGILALTAYVVKHTTVNKKEIENAAKEINSLGDSQ